MKVKSFFKAMKGFGALFSFMHRNERQQAMDMGIDGASLWVLITIINVMQGFYRKIKQPHCRGI